MCGDLIHLLFRLLSIDREAPHALGEALPPHDLEDPARLFEQPHDGQEQAAPHLQSAAVLRLLARELPQPQQDFATKMSCLEPTWLFSLLLSAYTLHSECSL